MSFIIINNRKEIVELVKQTLLPLFHEHGMSHDDFKLVAKTANGKIPNEGKTKPEIISVCYETVLEMSPPSMNRSGYSLVHQLNEKIQAELLTSRRGSESVAGNNNNFEDGNDDGSSNNTASKFHLSGDERITLSSLKNFMVGARQIAKQEEHEAGQRRQRF
jgi:hypothetical protein